MKKHSALSFYLSVTKKFKIILAFTEFTSAKLSKDLNGYLNILRASLRDPDLIKGQVALTLTRIEFTHLSK